MERHALELLLLQALENEMKANAIIQPLQSAVDHGDMGSTLVALVTFIKEDSNGNILVKTPEVAKIFLDIISPGFFARNFSWLNPNANENVNVNPSPQRPQNIFQRLMNRNSTPGVLTPPSLPSLPRSTAWKIYRFPEESIFDVYHLVLVYINHALFSQGREAIPLFKHKDIDIMSSLLTVLSCFPTWVFSKNAPYPFSQTFSQKVYEDAQSIYSLLISILINAIPLYDQLNENPTHQNLNAIKGVNWKNFTTSLATVLSLAVPETKLQISHLLSILRGIGVAPPDADGLIFNFCDWVRTSPTSSSCFQALRICIYDIMYILPSKSNISFIFGIILCAKTQFEDDIRKNEKIRSLFQILFRNLSTQDISKWPEIFSRETYQNFGLSLQNSGEFIIWLTSLLEILKETLLISEHFSVTRVQRILSNPGATLEKEKVKSKKQNPSRLQGTFSPLHGLLLNKDAPTFDFIEKNEVQLWAVEEFNALKEKMQDPTEPFILLSSFSKASLLTFLDGWVQEIMKFDLELILTRSTHEIFARHLSSLLKNFFPDFSHCENNILEQFFENSLNKNLFQGCTPEMESALKLVRLRQVFLSIIEVGEMKLLEKLFLPSIENFLEMVIEETVEEGTFSIMINDVFDIRPPVQRPVTTLVQQFNEFLKEFSFYPHDIDLPSDIQTTVLNERLLSEENETIKRDPEFAKFILTYRRAFPYETFELPLVRITLRSPYQVDVDYEDLYHSSLQAFSSIKIDDLRLKVPQIKIKGQEGADGGGIIRDYMQLMGKQMSQIGFNFFFFFFLFLFSFSFSFSFFFSFFFLFFSFFSFFSHNFFFFVIKVYG